MAIAQSTSLSSTAKPGSEVDLTGSYLSHNPNERLKQLESLLECNKHVTCFSWDKPKATFGMFAYKAALKHVELDHLELESQNKLKHVKLEHVEAKSLMDNCYYLFSQCVNLLSVKAPKIKCVAPQMFFSCYVLNSVDMPNLLEIQNEGFRCCYSLEEIRFPLAKVIEKQAFKECLSLSNVDLPEATTIDCGAFCQCVNLSRVMLPKAVNFGSAAFRDCQSLKNVSLPQAKLNETSQSLFDGCLSLKKVSLPATECLPSGVFSGCPSLDVLVLGGAAVVEIESVNSVFSDCENFDFERPTNQVIIIDYSGDGKPKPLYNFSEGKAAAINDKPQKTGVIYVPDNLVEAYKNDKKWSELASQIKGVSEMPRGSENNN